MSKQYKNHSSVPSKFKWDLSFLLEGKTPEKALNELVQEMKKEIKIKDSKYDSANSYLKFLKNDEKLIIKSNKFENYISNLSSLNVIDAKTKKLQEKFEFMKYQLNNEMGPELPRFFKHAKNLKKWSELESFKDYKFAILKTLEEKKYELSKDIQKYNLKVSRGVSDLHEIFSILTDSEIDYGYAKTLKGNKIKITRANITNLQKHKDKNVRKTTYNNFRDAYLKNKNSLANVLSQHKKQESADLLARGFSSSVSGLIFNDRIDNKFLETLYNSVQSHVPLFKKYKDSHKKFYKLKFKKNMTKYDGNIDLVKTDSQVTVEDAIQDVKNALKPFGQEYLKVVNEAFEKNWVDFMSINNKRSGAYSIGGTYGVKKKLILMNFEGDHRSTETLAHEMGHSMHSYFSDKVQTTDFNSSYPIFLAEIASIFNELMLHDYWLNNWSDPKAKFKILEMQIKGFIGSVLRQTEFSNYEYDLYNKIDKGEPISSYESLAQIYFENSQKYAFKKQSKINLKEAYNCIRIPHFYYGFYVYKYAIGNIVANVFFTKYKQEGPKALKFYVDKFLSAGGHQNPVDILKNAGVDLYDPKTYELAFLDMDKKIHEYIKLGKKIFKSK